MNYTSIEQSKKLLKLGLSPESADMRWEIYVDGSTRLMLKDDWDKPEGTRIIPCWSVGALFNIIWTCEFAAVPNLYHTELDGYWMEINLDEDGIETKTHQFIIEAAFELMVKLLENNYINKKGDKH